MTAQPLTQRAMMTNGTAHVTTALVKGTHANASLFSTGKDSHFITFILNHHFLSGTPDGLCLIIRLARPASCSAVTALIHSASLFTLLKTLILSLPMSFDS
jgi:hypothetical protein